MRALDVYAQILWAIYFSLGYEGWGADGWGEVWCRYLNRCATCCDEWRVGAVPVMVRANCGVDTSLLEELFSAYM